MFTLTRACVCTYTHVVLCVYVCFILLICILRGGGGGASMELVIEIVVSRLKPH